MFRNIWWTENIRNIWQTALMTIWLLRSDRRFLTVRTVPAGINLPHELANLPISHCRVQMENEQLSCMLYNRFLTEQGVEYNTVSQFLCCICTCAFIRVPVFLNKISKNALFWSHCVFVPLFLLLLLFPLHLGTLKFWEHLSNCYENV